MANVNVLAPIILKWEGGYENSPNDTGNYTDAHVLIGSNKGITPDAYKTAFGAYPTIPQMQNITNDQFAQVLKKLYWDRWQADKINNQSVADILVDWVWASGGWGIMKPQGILNLAQDGAVGDITIAAVNAADPQTFFNQVKAARITFVQNIVAQHPNQSQWLHGWENRINSFSFSA
ncbi:MAG TPA: glycosyl hydrolase 108 family protein [Ferruginibacter sp.]|nr:glycosyl hydrolase 108 family protein [Ferruginibacter sp.]